jgi:fumarate reductase subunit D
MSRVLRDCLLGLACLIGFVVVIAMTLIFLVVGIAVPLGFLDIAQSLYRP